MIPSVGSLHLRPRPLRHTFSTAWQLSGLRVTFCTHTPLITPTMARTTRAHVFEAELLVHYQVVYNFLLRMTGNSSDAADLTQETYARAYQKLEHYQSGTNGRAWLFCLARNLFINDYRKRKRRGEQELDERTRLPVPR